MFDNNPLNNTLAVTLNRLESRLSNLEHARQPYLADWVEITEPATFGTGFLSFTNLSYVTPFEVGDRIRLKQGGSYKYFYFIQYGMEFIVFLYGGTDYVMVNGDVTNIAYSRNPAPSNFPTWINVNRSNTTILTATGTNLPLQSTPVNCRKFKMDGDIVTVNIDFTFDNTPAATNWLQFDPIIPTQNFNLDIMGDQIIPGTSTEHVAYFLLDAFRLGGNAGWTAVERVDQNQIAGFAGFNMHTVFLYRITI